MVATINLFLQLFLVALSNTQKLNCGYKNCEIGKNGYVNVHIVPHTHDDVGWLKTVDQYYYGSKNDIQHAGVQYILDSIMVELEKDPKRRFIYVEIAFFSRWYYEQSTIMQQKVKMFVNEGRLEFILGGWCMNDEASTHYNSIIDQHSLGFEFLRKEFGECAKPKIGWQIDPFGHSREQASLFAQFGFDALYFGRLDYQDKNNRQQTKTMEFLWNASSSLPAAQSSLFTGVLFNGYGPPDGFCFDRGCSDEPIMDNNNLEDNNVDDRVSKFLEAVKNWAMPYKTNHILMTMGSDFQFEEAQANFKNLDKLIKYVNSKQNNHKVNLFYSTPSCYTYAVQKSNLTFSSKSDDFFPYASRANTFWSGYFTSRPALKGYERFSNNILQACKQLLVLSNSITLSDINDLNVFKEVMGVNQHHDAVSGTEKQHVAFDYAKRLNNGCNKCLKLMNRSIKTLLHSMQSTNFEFCPLLNSSVCSLSTVSDRFSIIAYNPLAKDRWDFIKVPVDGESYHVIDSSTDQVIKADIFKISDSTRYLPNYLLSRNKASSELIFKVFLPIMSLKTFEIRRTKSNKTKSSKIFNHFGREFLLRSDKNNIVIKFDKFGRMERWINTKNRFSSKVQQIFGYYESAQGDNSEPMKQSSGAYIFRPNSTKKFVELPPQDVHVVKGISVQQVRQKITDWLWQTITLFEGSDFIETEWTVGPIPIKDKIGKEIVTRFTTEIESKSLFYTDANGREILERKRNFRSTWNLNQTEPIAGNYYPVNSRIYIKDNQRQFTVMTDRTQGGSSIKDGQIELMLHRRLLNDDAFGVGEPLNEPGLNWKGTGLVVRGVQFLLLDNLKNSLHFQRQAGPKLYLQPLLFFTESNFEKKNFTTMKNFTNNGHLLTLEPYGTNKILVRLEHLYEKNEVNETITISLKDIFPLNKHIISVEETALGADRRLGERLLWKYTDGTVIGGNMKQFVSPLIPPKFDVILNPMQIRTFIVAIE